MGRIFKIRGSYCFKWSSISHDTIFDGYIFEQKGIIHGYCIEQTGSWLRTHSIVGAFSNGDKGEGMSFCKMPYNEPGKHEVIFTTTNIKDESLMRWGVQYCGGIWYLGHADVELEELEWSEKRKDEIMESYNKARAHDELFDCYESNVHYFVEEIANLSRKTAKEPNDELFENVMFYYAEDGVFGGKWPF